jgi:hypothetical protein
MACTDSSHINALIGVGGTLAGTVLGFALRPAADWVANRRQISSRIRSIRTSVLFSGADSLANYSRAVFELRKIFVENEELLRWSEANEEFFGNWLVDVEESAPPPPMMWGAKEITRLKRDISLVEDFSWLEYCRRRLRRFVDGPKEQ